MKRIFKIMENSLKYFQETLDSISSEALHLNSQMEGEIDRDIWDWAELNTIYEESSECSYRLYVFESLYFDLLPIMENAKDISLLYTESIVHGQMLLLKSKGA